MIKEQGDNKMPKSKGMREKGKVSLAKIFQEFKPGDKVSLKRELSEKANFPLRMNGRTGTIEAKRGKAYIVKANELGREKRFIILPVHLIKLK